MGDNPIAGHYKRTGDRNALRLSGHKLATRGHSAYITKDLSGWRERRRNRAGCRQAVSRYRVSS